MQVEDVDNDLEHDKDETPEEELLETAKKRFKLAQETEEQQREREKDDLRFQVPEQQWDEAARRQRLGMTIDGVPTPARPILSIPKLDQPIQLVLNQERAAKLGVSIQPLSPEAGSEVATILEGIYRRIERDSHAQVARSWAFDRAVKAGRGAYRVNTRYCDDTDNPFDQEITIERILYQDAVYFDPAATKADFSDGEWAFVTSWMPMATYRREFPDSEYSSTEQRDFMDLVRDAPDWVRGDGEDAAILVCEYFYKTHEKQSVTAPGPKGKAMKREKDVVKVKWAKMTGFEVLETGDWNGKWIPLVPVIGRELQPFDSSRRWTGIIGPAKDAQRLYNYAASSAVELAALEPKAPYVGAEGQFEGHESEWLQANVRNFPYLEYKPTTIGGQPMPPPVRTQVDVGRLGPSMQLLAQADTFISITTATFDPSLGRQNSNEKSGKAIMALQQQSDSGNSHYLHNLADISMTYEAMVILDLIPTIYDRPGRIARTLDEEGESEAIMLNQPFYHDRESKQPIPLGPGQRPPMPGPPQGPPQGMMPPPGPGMPSGGPGGPPAMPQQPPKVKHYDLRKGVYTVAVSIGKQRATAMQEGAEEIGQILQSQPQLMPLIGPLYFKYREFPGAREMADLMKKVRDKQFPGLDADKDSGPTVEQATAKVEELQQQMQMMGQQLQMAMRQIETDQAKQQATMAKAQLDAQTATQKTQIDAQVQMQKAQMDNETKLQIEQMRNESAALLAGIEGRLKQLEAEKAREHDTLKMAAGQQFEAGKMGADQEHQAAMQDKSAESAAALKEADLNWKSANQVPLDQESEI